MGFCCARPRRRSSACVRSGHYGEVWEFFWSRIDYRAYNNLTLNPVSDQWRAAVGWQNQVDASPDATH